MSVNQLIPGSTTVIAKLELRNNPDLPVADMQHIEGGAWTMNTLNDRDTIPATLRQANITRCYVVATDTTYVLRNGIANTDWVADVVRVDQLIKLVADQAIVVGTPFSLVLPVDLYGSNPILHITHVSNLPTGLSWDGQLSLAGTPTQAGTFITVVDYTNPVSGRLVQYVLVFSVAGPLTPDATLKLQNFIGIALQCQQGLAWSFDVPQDLYLSSAGHPVSVFAVDGLPDGLTYSTVSKKITGTATEYGRFAIILQHTDTFGGNGQYVFSLWVHVAAPTSVVAATVGAANIDVVFNPIPDDPFATGNKVDFDYDLAWQLTQSDMPEFGQRAIPGSADTRFVGVKSISSAIAIAALGSSIGSTTQQRFYRFAVSLAVLRTLYPAKITVTFGLYGKRKSTNPATTAFNKLSAVTINRSKTSGIISQPAGNNVDFKTNGDALAPLTDTTGWPVGTVETLLLTATVNLSTGDLTLGTPAPGGNVAPTVANPAPDYTGTVGVAFNQTLSASEFADADGQIVSAVATGLPAGLVYSFPQHNLVGTPTAAGTYTVLITATDNQGATITDTLVITVAPAPNQPPVVTNPAPDYTGSVGVAFGHVLPDPEFTDSDGTIASASATGLPPGLVYNFGTHSIVGTPTVAGTYNVVITATDTQGATATDPLVIVIGPAVNQSPVVANHVGNQAGTVGVAFELILPANEFSDPDGTIASLSITGFPTGVSGFDTPNRRIYGIPTAAGTFTMQVTATDNQGATVTDSFNILIATAPANSAYQPDGGDFFTV